MRFLSFFSSSFFHCIRYDGSIVRRNAKDQRKTEWGQNGCWFAVATLRRQLKIHSLSTGTERERERAAEYDFMWPTACNPRCGRKQSARYRKSMFYSSSLADVAVSACQKKTTIHYLRLPLTSVKLGFNFFFSDCEERQQIVQSSLLRELQRNNKRERTKTRCTNGASQLFASLSPSSISFVSKPRGVISQTKEHFELRIHLYN